MKKVLFSIILISTLLLSATTFAFADDYIDDIPNNSHKIKNKWDLVGSFTSGRDLSSADVGRTWVYEVHIKQAIYGPYSKGVIVFSSGDDVITAHVADVKENYHYWSRTSIPSIQENLAAVGWAEYDGAYYNFMFIYSQGGLWIILSNSPYTTAWDAGLVWGSERAYQVLSSPWPPVEFEYEWDPHHIH